MRKNDAFVAKIVNARLTKGFMATFAPAESLPSPATLMLLSQCKWVKNLSLNSSHAPIFYEFNHFRKIFVLEFWFSFTFFTYL